MKLKIWTNEISKEYEPNQLYVKMESCPEHGDIHIFVVDKEGNKIEHGNLLTLDFDLKCLIISDHISDKVPLKTDIDGLLLHMSEYEFQERRKENIHQYIMSTMEDAVLKKQE